MQKTGPPVAVAQILKIFSCQLQGLSLKNTTDVMPTERSTVSVKLQALSLSRLGTFGLFHFHNTFTFTLRPLCDGFQVFSSFYLFSI